VWQGFVAAGRCVAGEIVWQVWQRSRNIPKPPRPLRPAIFMVQNLRSHIYLKKANDDLVSHCRCADALITFPPQMDCPWCGCGWLFTCIKCRKAFTFTEGVMVNESWEETGTRDLQNKWKSEPSEEDVSLWVGAMKELLADVQVGQLYVCLDGLFIPTTATSLRFSGWHSRHELPFVPHVRALADQSILDSLLGAREYWQRTAKPPETENPRLA
jgi:hypothetical protein